MNTAGAVEQNNRSPILFSCVVYCMVSWIIIRENILVPNDKDRENFYQTFMDTLLLLGL